MKTGRFTTEAVIIKKRRHSEVSLFPGYQRVYLYTSENNFKYISSASLCFRELTGRKTQSSLHK